MCSRDQSYVQISNSSSIGTVCSLSRRVIIGIRRCRSLSISLSSSLIRSISRSLSLGISLSLSVSLMLVFALCLVLFIVLVFVLVLLFSLIFNMHRVLRDVLVQQWYDSTVL